MTSPCNPRLFVISALLGLASAAQVAAAPITVTYSDLYLQAYDGTSYDFANDGSTAYGTGTLSASIGGNSTTTYRNWQVTGSGALFDFDVEHVRTGGYYNHAYSSLNTLYFTVGPNDSSYSLSGLYAMTGPASMTYSNVYLVGVTDGSILFQDTNYSVSTANEMFTLGAVGDGDDFNYNLGSITGTLLAGHEYYLGFQNYIQTYPQSDNGATATGCVTLSIGGATGAGDCGRVGMVPEPGSLALAGLALAGLGLTRRKARPV